MTNETGSGASLPISLFDYDLPEELIAQHPLEDRSSSRLMIIDRANQRVNHSCFRDITHWLRDGDLLVVNDTRVIPARVMARRETGGQVELLLLRNLDGDEWEAMARPARRLRPEEYLDILDQYHQPVNLRARILGRNENGTVRLQVPEAERVLGTAGQVPLPSYISAELQDPERYQTVYAEESGSVAAPTAGLHFTDDVLQELTGLGVEIARVTLHVGPGTFQPVKTDDALEHTMHSERYIVRSEAREQVRRAKAAGRRLVAVGTTSCRTLESIANRLDEPGSIEGETTLYITPGYQFNLVDALLTNFHLPKSTLLLLVSAFAGRELVLRSYAEAIEHRYRFYSFGDAMLIV